MIHHYLCKHLMYRTMNQNISISGLFDIGKTKENVYLKINVTLFYSGTIMQTNMDKRHTYVCDFHDN